MSLENEVPTSPWLLRAHIGGTQQIHEVVVSLVPCTGAFGRSQLLKLDPHIVVTNLTGLPLQLRQCTHPKPVSGGPISLVFIYIVGISFHMYRFHRLPSSPGLFLFGEYGSMQGLRHLLVWAVQVVQSGAAKLLQAVSSRKIASPFGGEQMGKSGLRATKTLEEGSKEAVKQVKSRLHSALSARVKSTKGRKLLSMPSSSLARSDSYQASPSRVWLNAIIASLSRSISTPLLLKTTYFYLRIRWWSQAALFETGRLITSV
jgi:hypothetical protein